MYPHYQSFNLHLTSYEYFYYSTIHNLLTMSRSSIDFLDQLCLSIYSQQMLDEAISVVLQFYRLFHYTFFIAKWIRQVSGYKCFNSRKLVNVENRNKENRVHQRVIDITRNSNGLLSAKTFLCSKVRKHVGQKRRICSLNDN